MNSARSTGDATQWDKLLQGHALLLLFPHCRTTASAVGLVSVRIGAILGISLFGLLVATSPAIPIIIVAILLSLGAVLAVLLPKTTRGTRLE